MSNIRAFAFCLALLTVFVADAFARGDAEHPQPGALATAISIQFAPELRAEVEDMLQRSATFRAQYQRVAETPFVVVGVNVDVRLCETNCRARTTLRRYKSGLIVAMVSIGPRPNRGEWITHEFEHILEQLDGQNLPQLARSPAKGVWYSGTDVIETDRAIRAGRTVRDELRQSQTTR